MGERNSGARTRGARALRGGVDPEPRPKPRTALPGDSASVATLLAEVFGPLQDRYTAGAFERVVPSLPEVRERTTEGTTWLVEDPTPVGTVSAVLTSSGCHVRSMAVHPSRRNEGIGRALLQAVEGWARAGGVRRIYLDTTHFLPEARRLYESHGFEAVSGRPKNLAGTPLITMEKHLS